MNDVDDGNDLTPETQEYRFRSPGSGVYQVRLVGEDAANSANLSFIGASTVRTANLRPGAYTAWIEPLGGRTIRQDLTLDSPGTVRLWDDVRWGPNTALQEAPPRPSWSGSSEAKSIALEAPELDRPFTIALSVDHRPGERGGWRGATPRMVQIDAQGAGLTFQLERPIDWLARHRWRMTLSIGGRMPWRVPLPMFRGGLQVTLTPSTTPTGQDFALTLAPMDPAKAALVASLHQMFAGSASDFVRAAASEGITGRVPLADAIDALSDRLEDPWAAAAAALLMARSGKIDKVEVGARRLHKQFPWLPDAAVVVAWADAGVKGRREVVEARCFEGIEKARRAGAPYFIATDALAVDMLTALSMSAADRALQRSARKELVVWTRRSRCRMPSGPFLSWEDRPTARGELQLTGDEYKIVARGQLTEGKIVVAPKSPPRRRSKSLSPPALSQPLKFQDDRNKEWFGSKNKVDGYSLEATFGRGASSWVKVNFVVRKPKGSDASEVEYFLPDSFHPNRVMIPFKDDAAEFSTLAYYGFKVGVWIAQAKVKLELDLTGVRGAPLSILEN